MNRKEYLATKIAFLLRFAADKKMSTAETAAFLVQGFEDHYGSYPDPIADGEFPDPRWVKTLWKMAEERKNTNSSFPLMCKFVLNALEAIEKLESQLTKGKSDE